MGSSSYNQAAYNLAAYNIQYIETIQTEGNETVTGNAAIIPARCISQEGHETITGKVERIATYIQSKGAETVTGAASIAAGMNTETAVETVTGTVKITVGKTILPIVRPRMGIYYSDFYKDLEILQLIREAREDLITSGWPKSEMTNGCETEMAITAIIVHCLQNIGEIDDDHAFKILRGLQTKAAIRKGRQQNAQN